MKIYAYRHMGDWCLQHSDELRWRHQNDTWTRETKIGGRWIGERDRMAIGAIESDETLTRDEKRRRIMRYIQGRAA